MHRRLLPPLFLALAGLLLLLGGGAAAAVVAAAAAWPRAVAAAAVGVEAASAGILPRRVGMQVVDRLVSTLTTAR